MASKVFQLLGEIVIEYNGGKIDEAKTDAEKLKKELENIEKEAGEAGDAMEEAGKTGGAALGTKSKVGVSTIWLGNVMSLLTQKAINLGKQLVNIGVGYNASMEAYETNFSTLLGGDVERAKVLIKDLETLSMESPLNMADTAKAAQDLLIYGTAADDIIPTLKMMGDVTLGNTERMARLALAYNQMLGKGKLMAQEQNQMTEAGVPIVDIVIDYYRKTNWAFKEAGEEAARALYDGWREEGLISAKDVQAALFAATQEGESFYGGMSRIMETYEGKMQMAAEAGTIAAGLMLNPFVEVFKSDVLPQLLETFQNIGKWAIENEDKLKGFAETLGSIANFALSPNWESFMDTTLTTWEKTVKPALEKVLTLVIGVEVNFPTAGSLQDQFNEWILGTVEGLPEYMKDTIKLGDKSLRELYKEYKEATKFRESPEDGGLSLGDVFSGNGVITFDSDGNNGVITFNSGEASEAEDNSYTEETYEKSKGSTGIVPNTFMTPGMMEPVWQSNTFGANGFYGFGEALNQFDAGTSGKLSQIIGLLSAILGAVSRPMSIDIRTLSAHINTQLGRTLQRTVL